MLYRESKHTLLWTHEYINIFSILLYNWFHNLPMSGLKFFTPLAHVMNEATKSLFMDDPSLFWEFWTISVFSQMVLNLQSVYHRVTFYKFDSFQNYTWFWVVLQTYDIDKFDRISSCASSNRWILLLTESLNY